MVRWLGKGADPGRIYAEGLEARVAVEGARDEVARFFGCRSSREVVFTSGATEAIAAAVWGASERGGHQVVTAVEHSAVRLSAEAAGAVTLVGVDRLGRVNVDSVLDAIRPDTACVHVQWANHEVGTLQPVAAVVAACRERGVLVHVDAAQAAAHLDIDFGGLGADLLSVSAHKFGGPAGIGALLVRRGLRLRPLLVGGDQERARRAGLENVPAIVGFGAACDAVDIEVEAKLQLELTRRVLDTAFDGVVVYGDPEGRVPHLVCLGILGIEPQA
ncbi:MAG: cysteine desulfurase, partial [Acidimicrobiaceae bacterium]